MEESLSQFILSHFDDALAHGRIQVFYQPVIRTISRQLCSFEALARWIDPDRGIIYPGDFIPVLEKAKRIHLLDSYVIYEVCRQLRSSMDAGQTPIPISINLSRLDFTLCDIFELVERHVSAFQLPHSFLYIEVTESLLAEQEVQMRTVVDRFQAAGYQVWMDDFGSGFSSLNMLKDYAFDELKFDMRFLSSFNQRSRRILTSMIQMAKDIDIHTLAEGVETEEQFLYLRNIGCEKVQGFFFGQPLPFDEALDHLLENGIQIEPPRDRRYYDEIGRVNFLSSVPFLSPSERRMIVTGRQLNSIPLALLEIRSDAFTVLFCNSAFEQNANSTGFVSNFFTMEQFGDSHPFSTIPARMLNLLENTRTHGSGHMLFVSNEQYYEIIAKRISRRAGVYCVLLQLNNLSQAASTASSSHLDEGLRQIYTLFDRIVLFDLKTNTITPLYVGMRDFLTPEHEAVEQRAHSFAERWIFPEDRERYLRFMDLKTLDTRMSAQGQSCSDYFRFRLSGGQYTWKQFTLLRYSPDAVLELVRDAHRELELFQLRESPAASGDNDCSPALLWKNLVHSDVVRLFWKDRDRRFLGVNRGFLDYYGFQSEQGLLGKNDEELGWHIHPDLYMNDEIRVIHEGITTHNVPGRCLSRGENREILANKTPLYNEEGKIVGLLGSFIDRESLYANDVRGSDAARYDEMTGLLNSRGLFEQLHAFQDEYYLRNTDFIRLHVSIDDMASINRQYGFDFGDKVIARLGEQLRKTFGTSSAIGRINGYQFIVVRQIHDKSELSGLRVSIRQLAQRVQEIDGIPITLYLSVGYTLYSEFEDQEAMSQSAEMRLLIDHDEHAPLESRQSVSSDFFRLYDTLPIAYAVYKVYAGKGKEKETSAVLFYANSRFEKRVGRPVKDMLGQSVRELFPSVGSGWYDIVSRAALNGETVTGEFPFRGTGKRYFITASQIIRHGYCAVTYQELDGSSFSVS